MICTGVVSDRNSPFEEKLSCSLQIMDCMKSNVYLVFWGPKTWLTKERCPIVRIMVYHLVERARDHIQKHYL